MTRLSVALAAAAALLPLAALGQSGIQPRIPQPLQANDAINHHLAFDLNNAAPGWRYEVALANRPKQWRKYNETMGNSFSTEAFMADFRQRLDRELRRARPDQRYRATGIVYPVEYDHAQDRLYVRPPENLDAVMPAPAARMFGNARPALLFDMVIIDFPKAEQWWVALEESLAERLIERGDSPAPLAIDVVYDFVLSGCERRMQSAALVCQARFDAIEAKALHAFDEASQEDRQMLNSIYGQVNVPHDVMPSR